MSGEQSGYSMSASPKFAQDLQYLRSRAMADPAAHGHLYRETLREIEKLRTGNSDGHTRWDTSPARVICGTV